MSLVADGARLVKVWWALVEASFAELLPVLECVSVSAEAPVRGKNEFSQGWSLIHSCEIGP